MKATFDMKKLASSLAKLNKLPKDQRPVSYQDYLQALSKIAGFSSYEAFEASGHSLSALATENTKARVVCAQYTSEWTSGHIITTSCKLNLQTFEVTDIVQADTNEDLESLIDEYVSFEGVKYFVVHDPDHGNAQTQDLKTYAFSCFNDFQTAIAEKIQAIESAKLYRINGIAAQYSIDGDWAEYVQEIFEQSENSEAFRDSLASCFIWHPEGMDSDRYAKYEWYFDAAQILFSTLETREGTKTLLLNMSKNDMGDEIDELAVVELLR